jgi:hypothetical protein
MPAVAHRAARARSQSHEEVAGFARLRSGERANGAGQPRRSEACGVRGVEERVVFEGADQPQPVLGAVAVATLLATHPAATDARKDGHALRQCDGGAAGGWALGHSVTLPFPTPASSRTPA